MTENDKEKTESTVPVEGDSLTDTVEVETSSSESVESIDDQAGVDLEDSNSSPKRKNSFVLALVLTVLIVGVGLAGSGYWAWLQFQAQWQVLQNGQQVLSEELEAARAKITAFESLNDETNNDWQQAVGSLETLLVESAQRLNAQANRTENRWPLEEALTLARLANQRLQLDASASIAIGLLSSADLILADLDPAAVLPIRRQIAADVLALQTTAAADVNGLYFQLDAVSEQVKALDWVPKPTLQQSLTEDTEPAIGFWESLKQVVVVTRLDVPMEAPPLLSDFERWRQHTLLLIEQNQLAVLARNQTLYDDARRQLTEHLLLMESQFDVNPLVTAINAGDGAELNPEWPDISASVTALESYLAEQAATADQEASE